MLFVLRRQGSAIRRRPNATRCLMFLNLLINFNFFVFSLFFLRNCFFSEFHYLLTFQPNCSSTRDLRPFSDFPFFENSSFPFLCSFFYRNYFFVPHVASQFSIFFQFDRPFHYNLFVLHNRFVTIDNRIVFTLQTIGTRRFAASRF